MTISETFKAFDNKIEQNSVKYNSDRQTAKSFTLSSGIFKWQRCFTGKRFEYSPLRKELQAQTDIAKDQYKKQPICATRWKIMKFIAEIE